MKNPKRRARNVSKIKRFFVMGKRERLGVIVNPSLCGILPMAQAVTASACGFAAAHSAAPRRLRLFARGAKMIPVLFDNLSNYVSIFLGLQDGRRLALSGGTVTL